MPDSSVRDDLYARFDNEALDTGYDIGGDKFLERELDGLDTEWAQGL